MQSPITKAAAYALFFAGVCLIIWCNLLTMYPTRLNDRNATIVDVHVNQSVVRPHREPSETINVAFVAKYAFRNMKVGRTMTRCLKSILKHTNRTLHLHVLADPQSFQRLSRVLYLIGEEAKGKFDVSLYNITAVEADNKPVIKILRTLFFTKDVGRYNDDMFFITEIFHRVFNLRRIIFLDLDLQFEVNIGELYDIFRLFKPQNLIGIGNDLQPQYRKDFAKYRSKHNETDVGSPRPGRQGFNTGVMLMDLDKIRGSKLYNGLLGYDALKQLCDKYQFRGMLGHQDFFTLLGMEFPEWFHVLDCVWNRQLDTGWRNSVGEKIFESYHRCPGRVKVYHGNGNARIPDDDP
ncbi:xyloside xylosyltransferase 1-like [Ornithodoros turicata]|uniref:xyloside xylosyltransferase 1-like n=1 Tax=Ornithodoros turicata TaxID=34597 RepID=UPI00313A2A0F